MADSPKPKILLVEDAHYEYSNGVGSNADLAPYFTAALDADGYSYDVCEVTLKTSSGPGYDSGNTGGSCSGTYMEDYDIVIWFTGNDFGLFGYYTLTSTDRDNLALFLDSGGKLFLTGQDIGFDIGASSFYTNYLHANFTYDRNYWKYLYGKSGDPVGNGKRIYIGFYDDDGALTQYYPSIIDPVDSYATGSFDYTWNCQTTDPDDCVYGTWYGAIRADTGTYKVAYFAFGFEGIKGGDDRESVMDWVTRYLSSPDTRDTAATPNVTNSSTTVNATCADNELFSYVSMAEYFINSTGTGGSGTNFTAADGSFDEPTEPVTVSIDTSALLEGNHTIYVHCRDKSGYWGKFDNVTIEVDRTAPTAPFIIIEGDADYTNDETPALTLIDASSGSNTPDYVRFSCDGSSFSSWVSWTTAYESFNIASGAGCTTSDGTKTVYVQAKDEAGNIQLTVRSDTITLDRTLPYIVLTTPSNGSYLKSSANITVDVNDSLSGIDTNNLFYNWNGTNYSFSDNTPFNPGWSAEGSKTLTLYITDNAGNANTAVLKFVVDDSAPYFISVSPANLSAIKSSSNITIAIGENYNFSSAWFNNNTGGENQSFTNSTSFNPGWVSEGSHNLTVWANDSAGNVNSTTYNFTVDDTPPYIVSVSPANLSNVTSSAAFTVDVADALSGVDSSWFDNGNGTNTSFTDSAAFIPGWAGEGSHNLTLWVNDSAGNVNSTVYFFTVDNTPPNTTDNATGSWAAEDQLIYLNCSDNLTSCDTTLYCIHNATESPCTPDTIGNTVEITCSAGSVCQKYIRYKSNDSAGNWEAVKSSLVEIDKKGPTIQIDNPKEQTYSAIVDILTSITDEGSGSVDTAGYSILNASNLSQVMNSSSLTSPGWNSSWNSSDYLLGSFVLNVTANDSLGNSNSRNVTFSIDNQLPSAVIHYPDAVYINESFSLSLEGKSANGSANLTGCNYSIYNSSGTVNSSVQSLDSQSCSFTYLMDVSAWGDGNYSINFTVADELGKNQTVETWFYLDKTGPLVSVTSPASGSWNNGTITVNYTSSDAASGIETKQWRYNQSHWSVYFTLTENEGTFLFDTTLCADTNSSDCVVELYAEDLAGNVNRTNISLNIDNSPPEISITSPSEGSWHSGNFTVLFTASDNVSNITCQYKLNGSSESGWSDTACGQLTADISYCQSEGADECSVQVKVKNAVNMSATAGRNFSIDLTKPYFISISRANGSHLRSVDNLTIDVADALSGADSSWFDNGNGTNTSFTDSAALNPGWAGEGSHNLTLWVNDSAGNVNSTFYIFVVDDSYPNATNFRLNITDPIFNDSRLYAGETIAFLVNITDATNVSSVRAVLNRSGDEENLTLVLSEGNLSDGVWNFSFTPASLETYTVSKMYINDTLGNTGILNASDIDSGFIVVNASVAVYLDSGKEINASFNSTLNLTFSFNKSVEDPTLTIHIPAYFTNLSSYTCSSQNSCSANGYTASASGNVSVIYIQATVKALNPATDTNSSWIVEFSSRNYSDSALIKTPYLNVSHVLCGGSGSCIVNQSQSFRLNVTVNNIHQSGNHTGTAEAVYLNFTSTAASNSTSLGSMPSGSYKNSSWALNITEAGNFTFTFFAWDNFTGSYNTTLAKIVQVKDTENPNITSAETVDSLVNINETITVLVTAEDNMNVSQVWLTLNDTEGNLTNYTLNLEAGSMHSGIWNFTFNGTGKAGLYNITGFFANDTEGNRIEKMFNISFEVRRLEINLTLSSHTLNIGENLTVSANISGNASRISRMLALVSKPGSANETVEMALSESVGSVYTYRGVYANITRSGNYTVEVRAALSSNYSSYTNFTVTFGNISLSFGEAEPLEIPVSAGAVNLSWFVTPAGGDLLGVSGQISIDDESIINITSAENSSKDFGNITYEQYPDGRLVKFEFSGSSVGVTNITLVINSALSGATNLTVSVNVTSADSQPPSVESFRSDVEQLNLLESVVLTANVSDNSVIKNVTFEIRDADNITVNYTADKKAFNRYELTFSSTSQTGVYQWKVHVIDASNNSNSTSFKNFTVSGTYTVSINTTYSIYNKGETVPITVDARNVNGIQINNFNLTLMVFNGTNSTVISNNILTSASYFIDPNYEPDTENEYVYYIYANVSKNGNTGSGEASFNVSRILRTAWSNPDNNAYIAPGSYVPMQIYVTNARGVSVTGAYVGVEMSCPGGECTPTFILLQNLKNGTYSSTHDIITPNAEESFNLLAYSIDRWKNVQGSGGVSLVLRTQQTSSVSSSSGTGTSGGGGGAALPAEECRGENETCEFNYECCTGICYERICSKLPETEERVSKELEFSIDGIVNVERGKDQKIKAVLKNKGDEPLTLSISVVSKDCCSIYIPEDKVELQVGSSKDRWITIHVPLYQELSKDVGMYKFRLRVKNSIDVGRDVQINVIENPLIKRLELFESHLERIKNEIGDLQFWGMNTTNLTESAKKIELELKRVEKIIRNDDLKGLQSSIDVLEELSIEANYQWIFLRKSLWLWRTWPYIVGGIIVSIIVSYFMTRLIMPYVRLRRILMQLRMEEKSTIESRRTAEVQYFKREIDEKTFRNIMVRQQDRLLDVRGRIKETRKRMSEVFGAAFSLREILKYSVDVIKGVKDIKGIKAKLKMLKQALRKAKTAERVAGVEDEFSERIKRMEILVQKLKGSRKAEAEMELNTAKDYVRKGMPVMAEYHLERCKKILNDSHQ
jgi:hypothetical protein